jgi:hypothetical protein
MTVASMPHETDLWGARRLVTAAVSQAAEQSSILWRPTTLA